MRHTFASYMLGKGVPVFKVARWLGHADSRITEQVYAHLLTYDEDINVLKLVPSPVPEPTQARTNGGVLPPAAT
jgi:integrase